MRKWRVGTLSMGLSLLGLGVALLTSQFQGLEAFDVLISWWPVLLVLLGIEVLLYVYFKGKENQTVHYDFVSVLFVGVLLAGCLALTFMTSVGVIGEVRGMLREVEHTVSLPELQESLPAEVKRVIVYTAGQSVKVDQTNERVVYAFGSYRARLEAGEAMDELSKEAVYSLRTVGDTLYVQLRQLPVERGLRGYYPVMNVTFISPSDVPVELRGSGQRN